MSPPCWGGFPRRREPMSGASGPRAFRTVRAETERRAAHLSPEDQIVQSMADASPAKWHRAHTTWFFETVPAEGARRGLSRIRRALRLPVQLLLCRGGPAARAAGARPDHAAERRGGRGLSRPCRSPRWTSFSKAPTRRRSDKIVPIVEIGLHHEQQHQELMLTDILHAFAQNPTHPAYDPAWQPPALEARRRLRQDPVRHPFDRLRRRRLLLRQRAAGASGAAAGSHHRPPSRHQRRVARSSWPTAATPRTICGCRTAGPRSRPRAGTRRAIGATSTAPGSR